MPKIAPSQRSFWQQFRQWETNVTNAYIVFQDQISGPLLISNYFTPINNLQPHLWTAIKTEMVYTRKIVCVDFKFGAGNHDHKGSSYMSNSVHTRKASVSCFNEIRNWRWLLGTLLHAIDSCRRSWWYIRRSIRCIIYSFRVTQRRGNRQSMPWFKWK